MHIIYDEILSWSLIIFLSFSIHYETELMKLADSNVLLSLKLFFSLT